MIHSSLSVYYSLPKSQSPPFCLLDRERELKLFAKTLNTLHKQLNKSNRNPRNGLKIDLKTVIAFDGEPRIGKSRLLEEIVTQTRRLGMNVAFVARKSKEMHLPFSTLRAILENILSIDLPMPKARKEDTLLKMIHTPEIAKNLCYLNDILHLKFTKTEEYVHQSGRQRKKKAVRIVKELLHMVRSYTFKYKAYTCDILFLLHFL